MVWDIYKWMMGYGFIHLVLFCTMKIKMINNIDYHNYEKSIVYKNEWNSNF